MSQTRDLKTMTDVAGNPEEERFCDFYYQVIILKVKILAGY